MTGTADSGQWVFIVPEIQKPEDIQRKYYPGTHGIQNMITVVMVFLKKLKVG
jgi:hypothetical protein